MPKAQRAPRKSSTRGPTDILSRVHAWVLDWARKRTDRDTADDLANDLTMAVWERMQLEPDFLRAPGEFEGFICIASRNALIDLVRSERRRSRREAAFETAYQEREPIWMCPEEQADYTELTEAHEAAVARVSERLREAYKLVAEEELTIAAAADVLQVAPRAIETRLRRMRAKLRKDLAGFQGGDELSPRRSRRRAA